MSSTTDQPEPISQRELLLTRLIDAPPELLYRAWTEPALIVRWFTPAPWSTASAETDVRPGGSQHIVMRSPEGGEIDHYGVYLEVVPNRKIVATDAFRRAWEPSTKAFMTLILTFEPEGSKTRYTARVQHWSAADRAEHEAMGFYAGWGKATDQLEELVRSL